MDREAIILNSDWISKLCKVVAPTLALYGLVYVRMFRGYVSVYDNA